LNNLTIVTGLFDIGRGSLDGMFIRSFDHYKEWFADLLRTVDLPMIVFCEKELYPFIAEQTKDRKNSVMILSKTLDDIRKFPFYDKVQKIRTSNRWLSQDWWIPQSPQARLELYDPLVMSKQYWMDEAVTLDPFDSDYFLWVDGGIFNTVNASHFGPSFSENIIPYMDKMLYLAFTYEGHEVHGFTGTAFDRFCGQHANRVVRATLWGSTKEVIKDITPLYTRLLEESLTEGYMGTEENIFTMISYLYPDKVNLHYVEGGFVRDFLERIR